MSGGMRSRDYGCHKLYYAITAAIFPRLPFVSKAGSIRILYRDYITQLYEGFLWTLFPGSIEVLGNTRYHSIIKWCLCNISRISQYDVSHHLNSQAFGWEWLYGPFLLDPYSNRHQWSECISHVNATYILSSTWDEETMPLRFWPSALNCHNSISCHVSTSESSFNDMTSARQRSQRQGNSQRTADIVSFLQHISFPRPDPSFSCLHLPILITIQPPNAPKDDHIVASQGKGLTNDSPSGWIDTKA